MDIHNGFEGRIEVTSILVMRKVAKTYSFLLLLNCFVKKWVIHSDFLEKSIFIRIFGIKLNEIFNKYKEKIVPCFRPGSNRRPSACEADVITTTPRKRIWNMTKLHKVYNFSLLKFTYFKKATKFCEIFTFVLCSASQK